MVSEGNTFVFTMFFDHTHIAFLEAGDFCRFNSLEGRPVAGSAMVSNLVYGSESEEEREKWESVSSSPMIGSSGNPPRIYSRAFIQLGQKVGVHHLTSQSINPSRVRIRGPHS